MDTHTDAVPTPYEPVVPSVARGDPRLMIEMERQAIRTAIADLADLTPQATDRPPDRPRRGVMRCAVAPWDPLGTGLQPYWVWYNGSAWVAL